MKQSLNREQLVALVARIRQPKLLTEELRNELLEEFEHCVPHPNVSDLIYWPERPMSDEEIVDEALRFKPHIIVAPPPKG
jgi:hypothetical protein